MSEREWSQERLTAHAATWLRKGCDTLADVLSTLQCLTCCAEDCLSEELEAVFGDYSKFTFDYYDMSFEVHGVPEGFVCSKEQQARFWALGFSRFWTHEDAEERRKPGEHIYFRPGTP